MQCGTPWWCEWCFFWSPWTLVRYVRIINHSYWSYLHQLSCCPPQKKTYKSSTKSICWAKLLDEHHFSSWGFHEPEGDTPSDRWWKRFKKCWLRSHQQTPKLLGGTFGQVGWDPKVVDDLSVQISDIGLPTSGATGIPWVPRFWPRFWQTTNGRRVSNINYKQSCWREYVDVPLLQINIQYTMSSWYQYVNIPNHDLSFSTPQTLRWSHPQVLHQFCWGGHAQALCAAYEGPGSGMKQFMDRDPWLFLRIRLGKLIHCWWFHSLTRTTEIHHVVSSFYDIQWVLKIISLSKNPLYLLIDIWDLSSFPKGFKPPGRVFSLDSHPFFFGASGNGQRPNPKTEAKSPSFALLIGLAVGGLHTVAGADPTESTSRVGLDPGTMGMGMEKTRKNEDWNGLVWKYLKIQWFVNVYDDFPT